MKPQASLALALVPISLWLAPQASSQQLLNFQGTVFDRLGASLDGAGDLNGDGVDDLLIGAPGWEGPNGEGRVRAYSGSDGAVLWGVRGTFNGGFASAVCGLGDVSGDGVPDVAIGDWLDDVGGFNAGRIDVFSGVDGAPLYTVIGFQPEDSLGRTIEATGDLNGDGVPDFVAGVPFADGAFVASGILYALSGVDGSELWHVEGEADFHNLGRALGAVQDLDGDGVMDVIAGLENDSTGGAMAGAARVYSGASGNLLMSFFGQAPSDFFGRAVDGAGDVNGDGVGDLLVGASGSDVSGNLAGEAFVYSGADGSLLHTFQGYSTLDALGSEVVGLGDVDGDGFDDLALASYRSDLLVKFGGHVRVHSGADGSLLHLWHGVAPNGFFAQAMAPAGDVNGDGLPDLLVGSPADESFVTQGGSASVWSGGFVEPPSFCFAGGGAVACPCGNPDPQAGCANSSGQGARLVATGSLSLSADDLIFSLLHVPQGQFGLVFAGTATANSPLADGVLCVGGTIQRFPAMGSGLAGTLAYGPGLPPTVSVGALPSNLFQGWYRDPVGPCGQGSNLSNAIAVTWQP